MVAILCYLENDRELACPIGCTFLHQRLVENADVEALDGKGQLMPPKKPSCPRVSKSVLRVKHMSLDYSVLR